MPHPGHCQPWAVLRALPVAPTNHPAILAWAPQTPKVMLRARRLWSCSALQPHPGHSLPFPAGFMGTLLVESPPYASITLRSLCAHQMLGPVRRAHGLLCTLFCRAGETDSRGGANTLSNPPGSQGCWRVRAGGDRECLLCAKLVLSHASRDLGGWSHPLYFTEEEIQTQRD